jgi:FixJ family two-component response regulator
MGVDFKGTEETHEAWHPSCRSYCGMTIEEPIVYVVDDDASVRVALDSLVRSVGFRVQTFATAQDFLQHKPVKAPGCLVLDVQMPGLNGLDLQRELLHADIHIPVIFVTGHADIPTSVRAMKAGAAEFLTKPFDDQELVNAIQQAVERDRAAQQGRKDQESELEAAARIQQGLMAVTTPQPSFAMVSGKNQPCAAIGGDFFSVVAPEDGLVVAIADVSGKGIAAAVMASLLQGMIHEGVLSRVPLPQIARSANEFFCVRDLGAKYATFVIACVRPNGELEYVNCGHVPPLIASAVGAVTRLRESNVPVGLLPAIEYKSATSQLTPGDRIICVTDGVTEAEGPAGDFFGDERLEAFAALGMSPDQIFDSVRVFCADRPFNDDCTVVGLHYTGNGTRS